MLLRCSRSDLRPELLVARHAASANSRNAASAADGADSLCNSSSQPEGLLHADSICRASLSPIGLDDLIWLHMLGDICSVAAKDCSSPLGGAPEANAFSA